MSRSPEELMDAFGLGADDRAAWAQSGLPPERFDDWLTDRVARQPAGTRARQVYGADDVHDFARRAILQVLRLGTEDHLLEIGCGGGLLVAEALELGARVTGIDHSEEMVALARERVPAARIVLAEADDLPFGADEFTAVAMSVVFFFFDRPRVVLSECLRVTRPQARLAVFTTGPELRGTPAAPEPLASRGHFHTDAELGELADRCGWLEVSVHNEGGGQLLVGRAPAR